MLGLRADYSELFRKPAIPFRTGGESLPTCHFENIGSKKLASGSKKAEEIDCQYSEHNRLAKPNN